MNLRHFTYGCAILDKTSTSIQNFAAPLVIFYSTTIDQSISCVGYIHKSFYILIHINSKIDSKVCFIVFLVL